MTAQDYILGTVKITDPAVEELVQMIKDLQKENTALKKELKAWEDEDRESLLDDVCSGMLPWLGGITR